MARPCRWTFMIFTWLVYIFDLSFTQDTSDKGLIVSTFPNWVFDGQLQVYHNDPSTFQTDKTTGVTKMDIGYSSQVTSLISNTRDNAIILLDAATNTIYEYQNFNLYMNHTSQKFFKIHTGVSASTSQIAFDWLTRNVYWTDGFYKWIGTHPLRFPNDTSVYKIIVRDHLTKPEGIALDPYERVLFWSDVIGQKSKIETSNLAGDSSTRKTIVKSDNPIWISSLSVDTVSKTLFWADIGRQTIQHCKYDGSDIKVLRRVIGGSFLAIALSKDVVCGTEYSYLNVMCFDRVTGNTTWFSSYLYQEPWATTVYDKDQQKVSTHPCENKNCEHHCFNMDANNAKCACKEGYKLKSDGVSCTSEHGLLFGQAVIIANSTDACMYDIHIVTNADPKPYCFLTNLTNLKYFAVDSHERMFYYVDQSSSSIKLVDMISNIEKVLYVDPTAAITGLAVDWITKNILWTDSAGGKIIVLSGSTGYTSDLVTLLDRPTYITIDPINRKMYWLTGFGYTATLEEGNLDGTGLKTLLGQGDITYPEALFFDPKSTKLYWINNADLFSMKPDGSDPTFHAYTGYGMHVLIYNDYSLWTTGDDYLDIAHLDSYYPDISIQVDYMGAISAIGIYDAAFQPTTQNNCTNFNGGCQHICEPTGATTMTCLCNYGYELQPDGKSCSNTPYQDSFALVPDVTHDMIYQVGLSDGTLKALDVPDINVPVSVIYDKPTKKIYWTNALMTEIRASGLKSSSSELIYNTWSTLPVGLAFDYSSGLLYFTTEYWWESSYIGCLHPHVGKVKTLIPDLDLPKNIALYPSKGLMFWTDIATSSSKESYIGSAFMDGNNVKKIVESNLKSPNGIVIDYDTDRIYWADAELSRIETVKMDGTDRKILIEEPGAQLVGLDISPPYLYYVGRNKQRISKYDMSNDRTISFMNDIHALGRVESVRVYPEQTQPVNSYCSSKNGECALFCLPTPMGRTCGCEDGETLLSDEKSCSGHITCTINIPNAILENRCIGHATGSCNFTCSEGYTKSVETLKCDEKGNWNHNIYTVCQSLTGACMAAIPHGHVTSDCDKRIGSTCTYKCNAGYVPADENDIHITCTGSGAWNKPVDNLCVVSTKTCPTTIANGRLGDQCPSTPGTQCDFSCNSGYEKNTAVTKLVCLSEGHWSFSGTLCSRVSTNVCPSTIDNGQLDGNCKFTPGSHCNYSCKTGYQKNPDVIQLVCLSKGAWSFNGELCSPAMSSCTKSILHGSFVTSCRALHGDICNYVCDTGYVQEAIVQHVGCNDGQWSVNTNNLCVETSPTVTYAQKQPEKGASAGTVAGVTIAAIIITVIVVLAIVYFIWSRKKPAGQYIANNTNLKFKRFDDSNVPNEQGISGFSNPIASQPDYGNFGSLREEGYVTAEISSPYNAADPTDVNVSVAKSTSLSSNGVYQNSDA